MVSIPTHLDAFQLRLTPFNSAPTSLRTARNDPQWSHRVDIPAPIEELCTKTMLVMTPIPGVKLVDGIRQRLGEIAEARGTTAAALEERQRETIASGRISGRGVDDEARATRRANALIALHDACVRRPRVVASNVVAWTARRLGFAGRWAPKPVAFTPSPRLINVGEILRRVLLHTGPHTTALAW